MKDKILELIIALQEGYVSQEDVVNSLTELFVDENQVLMDACKTVVFSYESDYFEQMDVRDDVIYKTCKKALESQGVKTMNKYHCDCCKKIVERESDKKMIRSYCSAHGRDVLMGLVKDEFPSKEELMEGILDVAKNSEYQSCGILKDCCDDHYLSGFIDCYEMLVSKRQ